MLEYKKWKWILSECNMSCSLFATVTSNKCHISLNTECFCGTFLEPIPCMDMHLSTMLECKKCDWFLSQCNMSCSLLTTVTSNICQYLHQYWLFLWRFFWHVPIRHREGIWNVRLQIACTNHATNETGVLTVCHSEQPYLHQNKISLWRFFWFGIIHNKDKHWEGLNRESLGKIKWNVPFSWDVNLTTIVSVSCSDFNHENENYTLITRAMCLQTPWMTLYYHKKSESKNAPQKVLRTRLVSTKLRSVTQYPLHG